jgi:hypothetical protein
MSLYQLQKLIREINRNPGTRESFMSAPADLAARMGLDAAEQSALVNRDYASLYRMGVHGLLLRPFSIIHAVSEPDYLAAIRSENP